MVSATKVAYQTNATTLVYQAPLALFYSSLVFAIAALAFASLTSFATFL